MISSSTVTRPRTPATEVTEFEQLYARHRQRCLHAALKVTRDFHYAEDAVQEAFLCYAGQAERFDPDRGDIGSWLVTLTHRRAVDLVRRTQRQPRPSDAVGLKLAVEPSPERGPQADAVAAVLATDVRSALATLTDAQQQILFLVFEAGYSERAIATTLAMPLGTVKTRKGVAYRSLRIALAHLQAG